MRPPFSRRRYVVDWKLQGSLCLHGLLYGALVMVAMVGGIFVPLIWNLGDAQSPYYGEQAIVMLYLHERMWFLVLLCALIVAVSALKMSHRIAGPLVRYKRNLRLIADGKLPPALRTRPGDYLQEEVACLNHAVRGVRQRVDAIRAAERRVREQTAALATLLGAPGESAALQSAVLDLEAAVGAFVDHDPGDGRAPVVQPSTEVALAGAGGRAS